jgi:hypothetical protein
MSMSEAASTPLAPSDDGEMPLTIAELRELSSRARATEDAALHRLVRSYLTLRRVAADVIASIEAREGGAAVARNPLLVRARALCSDPNVSSLRGRP